MCVLLFLTQSLLGNAFKVTQMLQYMESLEKCSLSIIVLPLTLLLNEINVEEINTT